MTTGDPLPLTVNLAHPIFMEWVLCGALFVAVVAGFVAFALWLFAEDGLNSDHSRIIAFVGFIVAAILGIIVTILLYGVEWQRYRNITGRG